MFTITSFAFFVFVAAALALYYIFPRRGQWIVLFAFSLAFVFFSSGPAAFIYVAADVAAVYFGTVLTARTYDPRRRTLFTTLSIIVVVIVLFLLRYSANMLEYFVGMPDTAAIPAALHSLTAPIGISYFSLSAIGYILDVNWRTCRVERNPLRLALLILWFPALVCGPVTRYGDLSETLLATHRFDYDKFKSGSYRMLYGLFKKLVIANRLAIFTGTVFSPVFNEYKGLFIPTAALLYAFQIYADFSGCMDIMLGVSEMLQVGIPENFRQPFFSQSLSEFWRRWHITLGQWAKDYVMYPLLKSRAFVALGDRGKKLLGKKAGKRLPTYLGMLVLWLVIGLWHGGTPKHIFACGILLWFFIVGGQICQPLFDKLSTLLRVDKRLFGYKLFASLRTLFLMCVTWIFFNAQSVAHGVWMLKNSISVHNWWIFFDGSLYEFGMTQKDFTVAFISFIIVLCVSIAQEKNIDVRKAFEKQQLVFKWIVLLGGIIAIMVFGIYGPGYNAADFIYRG